MKKKTVLMFLTWFLILECLAGCARQDYSYFMVIGDYEIVKEEYALLAYDNIAITAREYGTQEGTDVNAPGFWEQEKDHVSPMDRVRELTDGQVIHEKGIQILAKEYGLIDDIGYDAFLRQHGEENQLRKEKKEAGGVVYGPLELTINQYYSYRQSQLEQALTEYVEQEVVTVTEQELEEYYPVVKEQEGKKNFKAELCLTIREEGDGNGEQEVEVESMTVDTLELGKENQLLNRIVLAVADVEPGQRTEAIEYTEGKTAVIEVVTKEYIPFGDYESQKDYVEYLLRQKKASEYIEEAIGKLEVKRGVDYETLTYEDIVK